MSGSARAVAWLLAASAGPALGATVNAPPPDAARYPALASLVTWLKSDSKDARNCSTTVALTLSARAAYEKSQSEPQAIDEIAQGLVRASGGKTAPDLARKLAVGYVHTAVVFLPLPRDAAGMGVAALCRSAIARGDRPFGDEALLKRLIGDAKACLSGGFAGAATPSVPMDCVVRTFDRK